jgi:UPF0042 nucleotide-binding protein
MSTPTCHLIVVSGLSGAGKNAALHALEDLGYYCVDNLPICLLDEFARHILADRSLAFQRVAVGIDVRNPPACLDEFPAAMDRLTAQGIAIEVLFLECDERTLLRRFTDTRRGHPLSSLALALPAAIEEERGLLAPLFARATVRLDTSHTTIHHLRARIQVLFGGELGSKLFLQIFSFGFKQGTPLDADFLFDLRCLPNPYWQPGLRGLPGTAPEVIAYLEAEPTVAAMHSDIRDFLNRWIRAFEAEGRRYLTVAFGCTGGHHRSVYMAERISAHFRASGTPTVLTHRDL